MKAVTACAHEPRRDLIRSIALVGGRGACQIWSGRFDMPRIGIDSSLQRAGVHGQRVPGRDRRELNAEGEWIRLRLDFISRRGRAPVAAVNERGVPVAIRDLEV